MRETYQILAHEYVVSLFPVFMLSRGLDTGTAKLIGARASIAFKIEQNAIVWYTIPSGWRRAHRALVRRIKKNPNFLRQTFVQMEKLGKAQVRATSMLMRPLAGKSNRALLKHYNRFIDSNTAIYSYGLLLPLLDYQDTTFFSDELSRILEKHDAQEHFEMLTTPLRDTFNKEHELNLLRIFLGIRRSKRLAAQFKTHSSQKLSSVLQQKHPQVWRRIRSHTRKWAWVPYVYEGPPADELYFIDILKDMARRNIEPSRELAAHRARKKALGAAQERIVKKLGLSRVEQSMVEFARGAVFYKPYRRDLQSHSYYHMEFLLREIARRPGLSLAQVRMMLPSEVGRALAGGAVDADVLNERLQMVVYEYRNGRERCLSGRPARSFLAREVEREPRRVSVREISGTVAFRGSAKGTVRIVNMPADMVKMQEGDILVARTTSPNLMPAIRKAAALVTDEGGLTCHAAIVSREFKIPCVIGTKIATQVLKDGDRVEVDAKRGIVKKL